MILYFILGILFIEVAIPLIESFVALILSYFEVVKSKMSLDIATVNTEIQKLGFDDTPKNAIGFAIPTEDQYEEEEEEYNE